MPGYSARVITLPFPELTEEGDATVHVTIRNPQLLPLDDLKPGPDVPIDANGVPLDQEAAEADMYRRLAALVVGWHVYDARVELDPDSGQVLPQERLALPATAESVRRLPNLIQRAMIAEVDKVGNPPR